MLILCLLSFCLCNGGGRGGGGLMNSDLSSKYIGHKHITKAFYRGTARVCEILWFTHTTTLLIVVSGLARVCASKRRKWDSVISLARNPRLDNILHDTTSLPLHYIRVVSVLCILESAVTSHIHLPIRANAARNGFLYCPFGRGCGRKYATLH